MSRENLQKFIRFLAENEAVQANIKEFQGNADNLAAFARENGFDVSCQELEEYQIKVANSIKSQVEKKLAEKKNMDLPKGVREIEKLMLLSETDKNVAKRLQNINIADAAEFINCGKELGFNFNEEDMRIFAEEIVEQSDELSDEDLELAAGGTTTVVAAVVVSGFLMLTAALLVGFVVAVSKKN